MRKSLNLAAALDAVDTRDEWHQLTLGQLIEHYLLLPESGDEACRLKVWSDALGHAPAWSITPAMVTKARDLLLESGYKPSTVNRMLASLGQAYGWIIRAKHSPKDFASPTLGVERFKEPPRRVFIEDRERKALAQLSLEYPHDARFGVFINLLLDTGARRSEVEDRIWSEIDLDRCEIILHDTKNGTPRVLHFSQRTADLIRQRCHKRPADALVFGNRLGRPVDFRKAWGYLTKLIGRPELHLHDLRHDAARRMLSDGHGMAVVASALGHGVKVLEARYGHLASADQRRAVESIWAQAA